MNSTITRTFDGLQTPRPGSRHVGRPAGAVMTDDLVHGATQLVLCACTMSHLH
jgi:hypothetical protein